MPAPAAPEEVSLLCLSCTRRRLAGKPPKVCDVCPTLQPAALYARKEKAVEALVLADLQEQQEAVARAEARLAAAPPVKDELPRRGRPRKDPRITQADARRAGRQKKRQAPPSATPEDWEMGGLGGAAFAPVELA
jgi:hypothetical protein